MSLNQNTPEGISLVRIYADLQVVMSKLERIEEDVERKHRDNRSSIHDLRGDVQNVMDSVWKLRLKIAGYSALGSLIGSVITTLIVSLVRSAFRF